MKNVWALAAVSLFLSCHLIAVACPRSPVSTAPRVGFCYALASSQSREDTKIPFPPSSKVDKGLFCIRALTANNATFAVTTTHDKLVHLVRAKVIPGPFGPQQRIDSPNHFLVGPFFENAFLGDLPMRPEVGQSWSVKVAPWFVGPAGTNVVKVVNVDRSCHRIVLSFIGSGVGLTGAAPTKYTVRHGSIVETLPDTPVSATWSGSIDLVFGVVVHEEMEIIQTHQVGAAGQYSSFSYIDTLKGVLNVDNVIHSAKGNG